MISTNNKRQVLVGYANTLHDPALCIIHGEHIYAEALERHMQCKRAMEGYLYYSHRPITGALSRLGLGSISDFDVTAVSSWDTESAQGVHKLEQINESSHMIMKRWKSYVNSGDLFRHFLLQCFEGSGFTYSAYPSAKNIKWSAKTVKHHLSHAANAVYTSPFDECVVMVLDGMGEEGGADFYHFANNRFESIYQDTNFVREITSRSSVQDADAPCTAGTAYFVITICCGFSPMEGEEWKVMGLAAYGRRRADLYDFFKKTINVSDLDLSFRCFNQSSFQKLGELVGGFRKPDDPDILRMADLAHNFQLCFEEAVLEVVRNLSKRGLSKNLAFAGGCALNSSLTGKISRMTDFERVHVPSAPADDGNALGVALYEKYCVRGEARSPAVGSPYLGSLPNFDAIERIARVGGARCREMPDEESLCDEVAGFLAQGKIVGWMQGRAEFGPRALGNRSILADPRPENMRDRINERVKFREEYRPLAPSILHEYGSEYFENYVESPYMERALVFKEEVRKKVPAVVHKDGTGRLQTVKKEWNPLFHKLIQSFREKTGIPVLLNTSFNVMGKPIVHTVEDAMAVFYTSGIDYCVIGKNIFSKNGD